jgi:hypothetical protein
MTPTHAPPAALPEARPIDAAERLPLLDTLRGFALCGVFMANVYLWFSGRMFLSREQYEAAYKDPTWLDMHGSWLDTVRVGAAYYVGDLGRMLSIFFPVIVGRFLLGLCAGRRRLFHEAPAHLPFFRRLFAWGLGLELLASGVGLLMGQLMSRKVLSPDSLPWLPYALVPEDGEVVNA